MDLVSLFLRCVDERFDLVSIESGSLFGWPRFFPDFLSESYIDFMLA
jgi:hypothetical protein